MTNTKHVLSNLVGRTVRAIHMADELLVFETDAGQLAYEVAGDCCSYSYFHDFFGVEHLLNNGPVTKVGDVDLADDDPRFKKPVKKVNDDDYYSDVVRVYGYKIVTVHPQFGKVTSVLSFRNSSNGYYGGWMDEVTDHHVRIPADARRLTTDYAGD